MLIEQILQKDTTNCYKALSEDPELKELEDQFYALIENIDHDFCFEMETVFSAFMAQVTRLAYLQGLKDMAELHVVLQEDVKDIMSKYIR